MLIVRAQDTVLNGIDTLVEAYQAKKDGSEGPYLLGELYFATDHWLAHCKRDPQKQQGRQPAMLALFTVVAKNLASVFGGNVNTLPNDLEQFYGTRLTAHGVMKDSIAKLGSRHYMARASIEKYRLQFRGGLAYGLSNYEHRAVVKFQLASSGDAYDHIQENEKGLVGENWSHFAMGMSREIYMGPHMKYQNSRGETAYVHSSWLSGTPVQCAGSIFIDKGVVLGVRNNSGHYQPSDDHLVNVLQQLKLVGANIAKVLVYDYNGNPPEGVAGDKFLAERGSWERLLARGFTNAAKDLDANRMQRLRRDYEECKFNRISLRALVEKRMREMQTSGVRVPGGTTLWAHAYRSVCLDFVPFDVSWQDKAAHPPPPIPLPHQ